MEEEGIINTILAVFIKLMVSFVLLTCIVTKCTRGRSQTNKSEYHRLSATHLQNNEWKEPLFPKETQISEFFRKHHINLDRDEWKISCEIVDRVLRIVAHEMRKSACTRFPRLSLGKILRKQGSSREGLKVCDPFEFDVLLPFYIENVTMRESLVFDEKEEIIPGLFKMEVLDRKGLPSWMERNQIICLKDGHAYIDTSNFQKKVFASLLGQTQEGINRHLKEITRTTTKRYRMDTVVDSPNLKIIITIHSENGITDFRDILPSLEQNYVILQAARAYVTTTVEIDLVPGLFLSEDNFQQNASKLHHQSINSCERYGVLKWVNKMNYNVLNTDRNLVWRNSTCGYEKCIFDIAQGNLSQLYIMTACRLLKGALRTFPAHSYNQLRCVIKSYHLKIICLYCILFLTIPSEQTHLSSVKEAMGYFIKFLQLSLESENLPHFFFGNPYLDRLFPGSPFGKEKQTYNMFSMNSSETLRQAKREFLRFRDDLEDLYIRECSLDAEKIKLYADLL